MSDIEQAVQRQLADAEKQAQLSGEAITKFATEVSEKIIQEELPFPVVFNGLTAVASTFLLEYCVQHNEGNTTLNLERLDKAFEFFVKGLEQHLRHCVEGLREQAEQNGVSQEQASSIITGV